MSDDRVLVRAFLERGDESSFTALYRRHTALLWGMACRLTGGEEDVAADLVEDTWLQALRGLPGFAWRSKLSTWLAGILVNCHRSRNRAVARRGHVELVTDQLPSRAALPDAGLGLEDAIRRLPAGYREVVVLYHVYGYKHREIAELLGIEVGTSKSQLARGLRSLREMLG